MFLAGFLLVLPCLGAAAASTVLPGCKIRITAQGLDLGKEGVNVGANLGQQPVQDGRPQSLACGIASHFAALIPELLVWEGIVPHLYPDPLADVGRGA